MEEQAFNLLENYLGPLNSYGITTEKEERC